MGFAGNNGGAGPVALASDAADTAASRAVDAGPGAPVVEAEAVVVVFLARGLRTPAVWRVLVPLGRPRPLLAVSVASVASVVVGWVCWSCTWP